MKTQRSTSRTEPEIQTSVVDRSIDELSAFDDLSTTAEGAVLVFQGRVRESNEGRRVAGLTYEAYTEMAERELRAICEEATGRFDIGAVRAIHRVGKLELGEVSVVIGVAAAHRDVCYEASRYVIEELKQRLPVWKHERYAEGDSSWVGSAVDETVQG